MKKKTHRGDPRIVVGYVRVSTDDQALGPDAQRAALERWCTSQGATLATVYEDRGVSGGAALEERPALLAALEALPQHGAGVLAVARRDRLARDVVVAAMIERLVERGGARIMAADGAGNGEGPEAILLRGLVDLFAQYERALIRSRTAAALAVKRSRGERVGAVPIGFRLAADGRRLDDNEEERRAIERVGELRATGASLRQIAERLDAEGVRPRGARWHATTIARLLRRSAA